MTQSNLKPAPVAPKTSFAAHLEVAPNSSGPWYELQLFLNGNQMGWMGIDSSGYCVLVSDQSQALKIRDYPYNGTLYLQTEDGGYLSVSDGYHYVGKYGWNGARGWTFGNDGSLVSSYNNQGLSLYSVDNAYLYCNSGYSPLTVKRAYV